MVVHYCTDSITSKTVDFLQRNIPNSVVKVILVEI